MLAAGLLAHLSGHLSSARIPMPDVQCDLGSSHAVLFVNRRFEYTLQKFGSLAILT